MSSLKPVSVIIYIKNNAEHLLKQLPYILNQKYKNFEVLLVNHGNYDQSMEQIYKIQQKHTEIKIINVENKEGFWNNKKYALTLGIKASSNDYILLSDVYSKPSSSLWINEFMASFCDKKTFVLGYRQIDVKQNVFCSLFIRFINVLMGLKLFAFAYFGNAYKAYRENFAFSKKQFFEVKGFANHLNITSNESDLFLKDASNKKNTAVLLSPNSFVVKQKQISLKQFVYYLKKELSLYKYYTLKTKILLFAFNFSKILFYALAAFIIYINLKLGLTVIVCYFLLQYILISRAFIRLKESKLLYFLPFLDVFYAFFIFLTFVLNTILNSAVSKSRL
ncbi:MAG: glycosyltransferase [Tenacibaculum sp.]